MPTTYSYPGVYVEEIQPLSRPIAGVSTSTAGFIGVARGTDPTKMPEMPESTDSEKKYYPIQAETIPKLVTSWDEFCQSFGTVWTGNKHLALAVYGFFDNGGTRCHVARIETLRTADIDKCLKRFAEIDEISIVAAPLPPKDLTPEELARESAAAVGRAIAAARAGTNQAFDAADQAYKRAVADEQKAQAEFKKAEWWRQEKEKEASQAEDAAKLAPDDQVKRDAAQEARKIANAAKTEEVSKEASRQLATQLKNSTQTVRDKAEKAKTDAEALNPPVPPANPPVPPAPANEPPPAPTLSEIHSLLIKHCEQLKDRFAILDSSPQANPETIKENVPSSKEGYAALYFPWLEVSDLDPESKTKRAFVPSSGAIAGIYARTDSERGVHKAPANESVRGALGLGCQVTRAQQEGLNPIGVNCIRNFYGSILVWGARTLAADPKKGDLQWTYVNVRRFMNFLRESIEQNLRWVVFEPNDPGLWQRIVRTVSDFLLTQWRAGALFGETPKQAFFVRCDASTNPPQTRELGQVVTEIGVAIVKPAEFVIFRIQQQTGG